MRYNLKWTVVVTLAISIASGCGGGGGGGGKHNRDEQTPGPGPDPGGNPVVNPNVTGKLYLSGPADYLELDMPTGIVTAITPRDYNTNPSQDASVFVTTVTDEFRYDGDDIVFYGRDGRTLSHFGGDGYDLSTPKLSRDGTLVAAKWDTDETGFTESLTVFTVDGQVIAKYEEDGFDFSSWDWLPDGNLIFSTEKAIYRINPRTNEAPQLIQRFPEFTPFNLSVSPDGKQIAFSMGDTELLANHTYVINTDGSGLRQLTTSNLNEDSPVWSADGSTIAFRYAIAYSALSAGIPGVGCPEVYVIPANGAMANISAGNTAPATALKMLEDGTPRGVCAFSSLSWRNATTPGVYLGTAIAGDGLNAGLQGRMFFEDPDFLILDVATGGMNKVNTREGFNFYPSWSGDEFTYQPQNSASGSYDTDELVVQSLNGNVTANFEVMNSMSGAAKLSPDNTLIAVEWHSIDLGDSGGVKVVTVFDRAGNIIVRHDDFDGWSWLPDGRLAMTRNDTLFITDANLHNPVQVARFSDEMGSFDISPDATRVTFNMVGHVWVANLDGSDVRQLTQSPEGEFGPVWSPDGRTIAVKFDESCPQVFVVPADGERVPIGNPSLRTSAHALKEIEEGNTRNVCAFSAIGWRS